MIKSLSQLLTDALSLIKGMIITFKNVFCPAVTLQYPDEKETMTERYRGLVDLDPAKCISCYQCARICPTGCLVLTHKLAEQKKILESFAYNMELCCFCGLCEQACPTQAVTMNKIYEIAVREHGKLHVNLLDPEKYREWTSSAVK